VKAHRGALRNSEAGSAGRLLPRCDSAQRVVLCPMKSRFKALLINAAKISRRLLVRGVTIYALLTLTFVLTFTNANQHIPLSTMSDRCLSDFQKVDPSCVRLFQVMRTQEAGIGHQISEVVFSLLLAKQSGCALHFRHFENVTSNHAKHGYSFVESLLGFRAFKELPIDTLKLTPVYVNDTTNVGCGVFVTGRYEKCPGSDCFSSPVSALAFSHFMVCLRAIALQHGTWLQLPPKFSLNSQTPFNVVWHVRVGDIELHPIGDSFYANILAGLQPLLEDFYVVKFHFIGEWEKVTGGVKLNYSEYFEKLIPKYEIELVDLGAEQTMLYMMHADVLIGSGSSLPLVAALFSTKALYVNVQPKHGWNYFAEFIPDGISVTQKGIITTHLHTVRKSLATRSNVHRKVTYERVKFYKT
tara:strand:- start:1340 stop:2578 length:1239 start_codon:yes stop_codon:yes gene_type:complete